MAFFSTSDAGVQAVVDGLSAAKQVRSAYDSIAVTPRNNNLEVGATRQLTATATRSDGTEEDVTSTASWSSSNGDIAQISNGNIDAVGAGSAQITAEYEDVSASANVTVTESELPESPEDDDDDEGADPPSED